jgi:hypothetical protein
MKPSKLLNTIKSLISEQEGLTGAELNTWIQNASPEELDNYWTGIQAQMDDNPNSIHTGGPYGHHYLSSDGEQLPLCVGSPDNINPNFIFSASMSLNGYDYNTLIGLCNNLYSSDQLSSNYSQTQITSTTFCCDLMPDVTFTPDTSSTQQAPEEPVAAASPSNTGSMPPPEPKFKKRPPKNQKGKKTMKKSELKEIIREVIKEQAGASECYGNAEILFNTQHGGSSNPIPAGCSGGLDFSDWTTVGFLTWPEMCNYTGGPVYYTNAPDDWESDQLSNPANYFSNILSFSDGSSVCACYEELCGPNDDFLGSQTQTIPGKPGVGGGIKFPTGKGKPMNKTQSRTNRNVHKRTNRRSR